MNEQNKLWTRNFLLLAIANLLMAISFYFLLPSLPTFIVNELGQNKSNVGLALAAYTLSALLIRPLAGNLLDNYGRKVIFIIGFMVFSMSFGLYALVGGFIVLLILRLFHGLSWGITTTGGSTLLIDILAPEKRGEGIGIYGLSMTIAMAIGPVIAQSIVPMYGYQFLFVTGMVLALFGFVLTLFIKYPEFKPNNSVKKASGLIEKRVISIAALQLLFGICYGAVVSYVTIYQQELAIQDKGLFFIILAAGIAISRISSGKIFDKQGPNRILGFGFSFMAIGLLLLALSNNYILFYLSSILLGFGAGVMMPTFQAMANNMVDKYSRGAANATVITAFDLGIGGGSIIVGLLSDWFSISFSYIICSIIMIFAFVIFKFKVIRTYEKNRLIES